MKLSPYPGQPAPPIEVEVEARREGNTLHIAWHLQDPQGLVALPAPEPPQRRHDLWQHTCYEFFFRRPGEAAYQEFNLAPSGHWNVYQMDAYRQQGMREDPSYAAFGPFDLGPGPWELAVTAVIEDHDGRQSFWALAHTAPEPDFHHPGSFVLRL